MSVKDVRQTLSLILEKYRPQVVFAYLFGSVAQSNTFPSSDIDVAVFLAEDSRELYFNIKLSLYADFCRELKRNDIDIVVLNTVRNIVLLEGIVRQGIVLFDTKPDLREGFEHKVLHQALDFREQRMAVMGI